MKRGSRTDPLSFYVLMDTNNPFSLALSGNFRAIRDDKDHFVIDFLSDSNVTKRFNFLLKYDSKMNLVVSWISGECFFGK